jgi:hypothetical protein
VLGRCFFKGRIGGREGKRGNKPCRICCRNGKDCIPAAVGFVDRGVSYCIEAMKRPNAPPRAKPITPDITVFPGQDSITVDICGKAFYVSEGSCL